MELPSVLILSTVNGKADEIASKIDAKLFSSDDDSKYYLWDIDNKYYKAQVLICATENTCTKIKLENVEALIIYHDPQADNADANLTKWLSIVSTLSEIEVLLFVCESITDIAIKEKVMTWCLQRNFELIEMENTEIENNIDHDLECNKYGIDRIVEALHAHMWPNMILKGQEHKNDINQVKEQLEQIQLNSNNVSERLQMESVLDGIMGEENADFGELFTQLRAMKDHAASLPTNQRRLAAEQIVAAFWKAMGGDPSEIDD
ncbi:alpha- and gamma-adaptin-binding protein p34-like [Prorops nasuta]|uniref:alpha- and gamma-adaptin-binding protein p34-like n=1 Tax=Prorops nasuta TaxID=863751 RepID=UPI0034CD9960